MRSCLVLFLVAAVPTAAVANISWYTDKDVFAADAITAGYVWSGTETFEENTAPDLGTMFDPLEYGVANGAIWPTGLDEMMAVQANTLGSNPSQPSPRGTEDGLMIVPYGIGLGNTSDLVFNNIFADSLDLIFTPYADYYAVGFAPSTLFGLNELTVRAYKQDESLLGEASTTTSITGDVFLGVISDVPIGRININSPSNGSECADTIQLWVPEPASLMLAFVGVGVLLRRR